MLGFHLVAPGAPVPNRVALKLTSSPGLLIAANVAALWGLTLEAVHYFDARADRLGADTFGGQQLSLTVLWAVYAIGVIAVGIARQSSRIRLAGMALLAVPLAKLFGYDVFLLEREYRVAAFVTLGVLMLGTGFSLPAVQPGRPRIPVWAACLKNRFRLFLPSSPHLWPLAPCFPCRRRGPTHRTARWQFFKTIILPSTFPHGWTVGGVRGGPRGFTPRHNQASATSASPHPALMASAKSPTNCWSRAEIKDRVALAPRLQDLGTCFPVNTPRFILHVRSEGDLHSEVKNTHLIHKTSNAACPCPAATTAKTWRILEDNGTIFNFRDPRTRLLHR